MSLVSTRRDFSVPFDFLATQERSTLVITAVTWAKPE